VLEELEAREAVWFNHWGMIGWDWSGNGRLLVPAVARKPTLRYWIARLAPYWNVTWNLAGEWDELLTPAELDDLGSFIKQSDPWKHPTTSHALRTTADRPWVDFRVQQFVAGMARWRCLPLVAEGKIDAAWAQVGWGGFYDLNGYPKLMYPTDKEAAVGSAIQWDRWMIGPRYGGKASREGPPREQKSRVDGIVVSTRYVGPAQQ